MVYLGSVSVRPNAQHITFLDTPALDLSMYDVDDGVLMKTQVLRPSQVRMIWEFIYLHTHTHIHTYPCTQTFDVSDISPNDQRYITPLPLQSVFGPQYSQTPRYVCVCVCACVCSCVCVFINMNL